MDSIETRQRIKYLIEHGGLWENAVDRNERTHRWLFVALALSVSMQILEFVIEHVLH